METSVYFSIIYFSVNNTIIYNSFAQKNTYKPFPFYVWVKPSKPLFPQCYSSWVVVFVQVCCYFLVVYTRSHWAWILIKVFWATLNGPPGSIATKVWICRELIQNHLKCNGKTGTREHKNKHNIVLYFSIIPIQKPWWQFVGSR